MTRALAGFALVGTLLFASSGFAATQVARLDQAGADGFTIKANLLSAGPKQTAFEVEAVTPKKVQLPKGIHASSAWDSDFGHGSISKIRGSSPDKGADFRF
jgi:hypothetical protein